MSTGEAIQQLRETENLLIKKQEVLERKIEQELDCAKKNGTKNKRGKNKWFIVFFCCREQNFHCERQDIGFQCVFCCSSCRV